MRLESLTLTGITAFGASQTLDCTRLPAGIIALIGPNGGGKTTTLEAAMAALWRFFPSRDGALVDYATGGQSSIVVQFTIDGRGTYRARIALDHDTRKTAAVMTQVTPAGDVVLNKDGLLGAYDAIVAELLPPVDLLLATVFAAQNKRGSFIAADTKGRMALLSALLGLDHYDRLADRARTVARETQAVLGPLAGAITTLAPTAGEAQQQALAAEQAALDTFEQAAEAEAGAIAGQLTELRAALAVAEAAHAAHQRAREAYTALIERVGAAAATRDAASDRIHEWDNDTTVQRTVLVGAARRDVELLEGWHRSRAALVADQKAIRDRANREIGALERRIGEMQHRITLAPTIRAAVERRTAIVAQLTPLRASLTVYEADHQQARADLTHLESEYRWLEQGRTFLTTIERQAGKLATVPCGGAGVYASCALIADAVAAAGQVEAQRQAVALADHEYPQALAGAQAAVERTALLCTGATRAIAALTTEDINLAPLAAQLGALEVAEAQLAEVAAQVAAAQARATEQLAEASARELARQTDLDQQITLRGARLHTEREAFEATRRDGRAGLVDSYNAAHAAHADVCEALTAAQAAVQASAGEEGAYARLVGDIDALAGRQRQTDAWRGELAGDRRALTARVRAFEEARFELAALTDAQARLDEVLSNAKLCTTMFGRDGLPLLEIDAAGPGVSALTNDLLESALGDRRFTVELVTQRAKLSKGKDGSTMRDVLDLTILDSLRGGAPRSLSDLSGGEQVLVDEALKCGIALYLNQRAPAPFQTAFRDETTGALDPDNAARYMTMLRRTHTIGGFERTYVVTQSPEWALTADARVHVVDGTFEVLQ